MEKYVIVSGVPRSGTSMEMLTLANTFGARSIFGDKFPQENRFLLGEKNEGETDAEFEARAYAFHKFNPEARERFRKAVEMNPNGFWEDIYTMNGLRWHPEQDIPKGTRFIKVVSNALISTDPNFVERVIYMLRHPRAVATSQEDLQSRMERPQVDGKEAKNHSADYFISASFKAALWLSCNPEIPVHVQEYEKLVQQPEIELAKQRDFLGGGDFSNHPIDPKLFRSKHKPIESELWFYAERIYALMKAKKWSEVVEFVKENRREINKRNTPTTCVRLKRPVPYDSCELCRSGHPETIANFKAHAESKGIDWRSEPCLFEITVEPPREGFSMEDSIAANHWEVEG